MNYWAWDRGAYDLLPTTTAGVFLSHYGLLLVIAWCLPPCEIV